MANIERPLKTFGTRTYAGEVAAAPGNKAPILSAEVDLDLETIYAAWNGGVGVGDIAPGAIGPNELAPGAVTNAKLGPNAVTSDKILDRTIISDDLHDDAVITRTIKDLNVTKAKLELGATIWDIGFHNRSQDALDIGFTGGDQLGYLALGPGAGNIKSRGTGFASFLTIRVYLMGTAVIGSGPGVSIHARIVRDATETVADIYGFAQGWAAAGVPQELPWTIFHEAAIGTADTNEHQYRIDVLKIGDPAGQGRLRAGTLSMIAYS